MTLAQLIAQLRTQIVAKLEQRNTHATALAALRAAESTDEAEVTEHRSAKTALDAEVDQMQARVADLEAELARDEAADRLAREITPAAARPAYDQVARIGAEARTYSRGTSGQGVSFFGDAYAVQVPGSARAIGARDRLERHAREVQVEGELSERALNTGGAAGLVPPQYLVALAAPLARSGRPTANVVNHMPLPSEGMSLVIPRGTTGASVAPQNGQNTPISSTDEVWADLTIPVVTAAGQQDVSRQLLERGGAGIDALIYSDLAGAHAVDVDRQVLGGSGAAGECLGIFLTGSVNQATAFAAAVTTTTFYTKIAGQISAVQTTRLLAPDLIIGHPRRWGWLTAQVDSAGRPIVLPQANMPLNAIGIWDEITDAPSTSPDGLVQNLPFLTDGSVPIAVGTGPEDQMAVVRRADLILWEDGDGMPKELRFEQTLGGSLTVKLAVYSYFAFTAARYPKAVGVIGGNSALGFGLVAPTF